MFRVLTNIKFTQQPTLEWPNRNLTLEFGFVNYFECNDSWRDLTNKGKIVIPKNLYYKDKDGKLNPVSGVNINAGGFSSNPPMFLRGDKVNLTAGYKYYNKDHREVEDTDEWFAGYISKVGSKIPIEIEIEDNMWKLKQTPVGNRTFNSKDTLEDIMKFILQGTEFTTKALTLTTFGSFTVGNESAAQVLSRLQKQFGFEFYFKGDVLRGGTIIYVENEAATEKFEFQKNIISDEIEFTRKDDITLSAVVYNTVTEATGKFCKDGTAKTKRHRIEVLVTLKKNPKAGEIPYTYNEITRGEVIPDNQEGERRTFFFPGETTAAGLAEAGYNLLKKYYYTGFKGGFETFGIPFIRQGDNVQITNPKLPEQDGIYKVKEVQRSGGFGVGLRQVIKLDYKINT